jgi:hypothetical protein
MVPEMPGKQLLMQETQILLTVSVQSSPLADGDTAVTCVRSSPEEVRLLCLLVTEKTEAGNGQSAEPHGQMSLG